MRVHGKRVGKFMEHAGSYQSWRFIGLIVTRAKRRRRRCTRSKTSLPPCKNIFTRETERSIQAKVPEWKRNGPEQDRDVDAAVKTSKSWQTRVCRHEIYGLSLERSRFIEQTKRGVVEKKFSSRTKLHARRKHFRCEKSGKKTAIPFIWRKHNFAWKRSCNK